MKALPKKATVRWFNALSGEGMIRLESGVSLPIFACNIQGRRTLFPGTACVSYEKGQEVTVLVEQDAFCCFVHGLTPGRFDAEKWNSYNKEDLAFTVDEKGEITSGLIK